MDHNEDHLHDQDKVKLRALSPSAQPPANNDFSNSKLTEIQSEITRPKIIENQNLPSTSEKELLSTEKGALRGLSPKKDQPRPKTPIIEVEKVSDEEKDKETGLLPEGISDFYDFNRSRSPSVEKFSQKSRSPSTHSRGSSREPKTLPEKARIPADVPITAKGLHGLSDFYDFNVMMNQIAYGYGDRQRDAHTSSTDYLMEKLQARKSRSKSPRLPISIPKNGELSLQEEGGGTKSIKTSPNSIEELDTPEHPGGFKTPSTPLYTPETPEHLKSSKNFNTSSTPLDTPSTPDFQRSFSANMRHVERMRDEYRQNFFKRSTYVGESMFFENDFEDLREQTRHFRRSRSRSRSPLPEEGDPCTSSQAAAATKRDLQDRILEEITRTTINYQGFSRDINKSFIDYERRGSDSVLIRKPELMIQIQDDYRGGDFYDDEEELEGENYHHFRRFSLNQEDQVEEYPDDDAYLEQIEVQTKTGTRSWTRQDFYDRDEKSISEAILSAGEDSDHAEADDIDSESEDDRQTVVEVDDEIDEDVFDYEKPPEEYNEPSECEEAEREMDTYANRNVDDWNEEGAVGGIEQNEEEIISFKDDSMKIDQMYNDAVKTSEESRIEKDYDTIVNAINEEEEDNNLGISIEGTDTISVKTEDLLDEILREDEVRYRRWSPRSNKIEATRSFIDNEAAVEASVRNGTSAKTSAHSSTRLRSRYGIGPATVIRDYDDIENINVDLNYKPKKEYKWRKNFKLDDDNTPQKRESDEDESRRREEGDQEQESSSNEEALFQKSPEERISGSWKDPEGGEASEETNDSGKFSQRSNSQSRGDTGAVQKKHYQEGSLHEERPETTAIENSFKNVHNKNGNKNQEVTSSNLEDGEKVSRKKKTKRRTRKSSNGSIGGGEEALPASILHEEDKTKKRRTRRSSKGSIGGGEDALPISILGNVNETEENTESHTKKKTKKKKKNLESTSPTIPTKSPSPTKADILNATTLITQTKTKSPSPAKSPTVLNSEACNMHALTKLPEASKPAEASETSPPNHLTTTPIAAKSKSKSPEPGKSPGPNVEPAGSRSSSRPQLERNDSTGVYELIKDGSMYPWF